MKIPVYIGEKRAGELEIKKEGLYTHFRGEMENPGFLMRLFAEGRGRTLRLGLMKPEGKIQSFNKKLSNLELGMELKQIERAFALPLGQEPESKARPLKVQKPPEPQPRSSVIWRELPDGCLTGCPGNCRYLAFPLELNKKIRGIRRIKYKNREYILFRY